MNQMHATTRRAVEVLQLFEPNLQECMREQQQPETCTGQQYQEEIY